MRRPSADQRHGRADPWAVAGASGDPSIAMTLLGQIDDGLSLCDAEGRLMWVNEPFLAMYGVPDHQAASGRSFQAIYDLCWARAGATPDPQPQVPGQRSRPGGGDPGAGGDSFELPLPGGRGSRLQTRHASQGQSLCIHADITQHKAQQAELQQARESIQASRTALREKTTLLETMLDRMDQGMMMVNAQGVVDICNRRAIELLDLPPALMAGKPRFEAVLDWQWSQDDFNRTPADLQAFVRAGGIASQVQRYERTRPNGRVIDVHSVPMEGGGVLRTYTDITERKRAEDAIRYAAQHDALTGLANRRAFEEAMAQAIGPPGSSPRKFAVHFVDLDLFKPVNDRYGHSVGDQVLVAVGQRLRHLARDGDTVARLGGDEFAILQQGCDSTPAALRLAQRVLQRLRAPLRVGSGRGEIEVQIGASLGVAIYPEAGADAATLVANADQAMYAAKAGGRQRAHVHGDGAVGD